MKNKSTLFVSLLLALLTVNSGSLVGQTIADFFWSEFDLNTGATNAPLVINRNVNDPPFSLFLYYTTNGPSDSDMANGAFLDVVTSNPGVIQFTAAESFDFDITVVGTPVFNRWLDANGGGGSVGNTGSIASNFISQWHAFTVTGGTGILEAHNGTGLFLDQGYDAGADAFLWGRIDVEVLNPGITTLLTTGLVSGPGPGNPAFNIVEIHVTENQTLLGDVNVDGVVNLLDVEPFIERIGTGTFLAEADCNKDGQVNLLDIDPFIAILGGT